MVYRIYVEKKKDLAKEAADLLHEARELLQIRSLTGVRIINRYDVENIEKDLFDYAVKTVFSEPQLDTVSETIQAQGAVFAVEYLPGQFDQRADSAAQCIQIISQGERPTVRTAKVYVLAGELSSADVDAIKKYVINPVEAREAALEKPETLKMNYAIPQEVATLEGFLDLDRAGLQALVTKLGLAMDLDDIAFCQAYFRREGRCPTITEIRMIDTYWSDHCRHTTFLTTIDQVKFADPLLQAAYNDYLETRKELGRTKPVNLMDIGTLAAKYLRKNGYLDKLDESEEINACTVHMTVTVDGEDQPWLLLFKNETHNHPTEIEPFGGKHQQTPIQAMVHKVSLEQGHTDTCSLMSWGYNPFITERSPYHGAYLAVVESAAKLVATGAAYEDVYLTFQEYFKRVGRDPKRWSQPLAALLGAFEAQKDLKIAAIGGKDSMSGTFEDLDVPPTLVSFAVTTEQVQHIVSNEFKAAGHTVCLLQPQYNEAGLPDPQSLLAHFRLVTKLLRTGAAVAAYTPGMGGPAEAVMKMAFGNGFGFDFDEKVTMEDLFGYAYGSFVLELDGHEPVGKMLGTIRPDSRFVWHGESVNGVALQKAYEEKLEPVYSCNIPDAQVPVETVSFQAQTRVCPAAKTGRPKVLIPVFPGTNCEYDSAKAMIDAGAEAEIFVIRNLTAAAIAQSVEEFAGKLKQTQMVFLPGGFSGGDEPDGSAKFITAFFRNAAIKEAITALLEERDGLMLGICNGFQALIKLGLLPYGKILDTDADCPTLTYNTIGRHQSRLVRTRVASNLSPWLSGTQVGEVYTVPISHGEGRFLAEEALVKQLAARGQIATQYVDLAGNATTDVHFNPNGSIYAIEGITSPDGRILGKMGHSERKGFGLYKNVPGEFDMKLFESAVKYFK